VLEQFDRALTHVENLLVDGERVSVGSVWPMRYSARRGGTSQTARIDANVRRSVCGVMCATGGRPSASICRFARSRIGARIL
jgi:hypothetical protein